VTQYMKDLPCVEDDCERLVGAKGAKGRCGACNQRLRRMARREDPLPCDVDGCTGQVVNAGTDLCDMHRSRARRSGSVGEAQSRIGRRGDGYLRKDGYRLIARKPQHRLVMEQMLGRPLRRFEHVHHRNGIRSDNRPDNLELWTKPQPFGQRPEDLVEWMLENYAELVVNGLIERGVPMPMSNASMRGQGAQPPTTGVATEADGQAPGAPAEMGSACEQAASAAVTHNESEGRKVAMGGV